MLLTRESARRVVHLVNFSAHVAANIPRLVDPASILIFPCEPLRTKPYRNLAHTTTEVAHHIIYINHRIITISRLDKVKTISKEEAESLFKRMLAFYGSLQGLTNAYLVRKDVILAVRRKMIIYIKYIRQERVASFLSGRMEAEKVTGSDGGNSNHRSSRRRQDPNHYSATHNNINGVY